MTNWEPEIVTALDLRCMKASLTHENGDLIMRIEDEGSAILLETGASSDVEHAIRGVERLADIAHQCAALLRARSAGSGVTVPSTASP